MSELLNAWIVSVVERTYVPLVVATGRQVVGTEVPQPRQLGAAHLDQLATARLQVFAQAALLWPRMYNNKTTKV